jgi:O-acetylserine/cysteine efflux transporter
MGQGVRRQSRIVAPMPTRDILLALTVALLWGFNFVVMKVGVGEIPPLLLAALRFFLAAVPFVFFFPRPDVPWRLIIAFGLLFGVVKFGLLFWALRAGMPAGLSAVVLQTQVLFTVMLAAVLLGEGVTRWQVAGLALALLGLAVIGAEWANAAFVPFMMVVLAALAWAAANIITKRAAAANGLAFSAWTALVAAGPLIVLSLLIEGPAAISAAFANMSWRGIGAVLYLAYPVSLIGGAIWNGLLNRHNAAHVVPFVLLVPLIGMILGWLLLDETVSRQVAVGGLLVLLGLAVPILGPRLIGGIAAARSS